MFQKAISGILLLFTISCLHAQADYIPEIAEADTAVNFLEQVVVTGTRTLHTLKNVPVLTKVVSKIELNDIGAVTALDALENLLPGLTFNPDPNHGDNIQLQGLDNKYILVLLNGERMVNGRAENVNFSRISVADIQRIEIIDGAASVLYGSNAIGAVINIITKEVNEPLEIYAGGRYGSYNSYAGDVSVGVKGNKWSSKTVLNTKGSDGYRVQQGIRVSPWDDYYIGETFKLTINEKLNACVYGSAYLSQLWPYQDIIHRRETDYNAGAYANWQTSTHNVLKFAVNTDWYNAYTLENHTNDELAYSNYHLLSVHVTDTWNALQWLQLTGGYEFNREYTYAPERFGAGNATHDVYENSVFAQGEFNYWDDFSVVAGARLTQHPSFGVHFTPKLSLMYKLDCFRFRAGLSNGFKAPSLKEMYYDFAMPGGYYMRGNPDLKPEASWYTSVSAEYIAEKFNASVTAYNNVINDRIGYVEYSSPQYPSGMLQYENVAEAVMRGIDLSAQAELGSYFNVTANYAFADTEDKSTGKPLNGTSRHAFTGGVVFRYSDIKIGRQALPLSLNFSGRMSSPRLYRSVNQQGIAEGADTKTTSIWRVVYTQNILNVWKFAAIELQAGIDNLFDWTDPVISINPGRTWFVALKVRL